jgi:PAX-interacting protein 1
MCVVSILVLYVKVELTVLQWTCIRNSDDLSSKAKSKFGILLRGLAEPMSLREIAKTWDACARKVIEEYAQKTGGGSFSSSYGCWESCVA